MKNFFRLAALMLLTTTVAMAQTVNLPAPKTAKKSSTMMQALASRHSERTYSDKALSQQDLSDLLWAAMGVNRKDVAKLTAPTAKNKQEIRLFVFTAQGVSEYLPQTNQLKQVAQGDHRDIVAANQAFAKAAPVCLVMVGDFDKFGSTDQRSRNMVAADAGIVSQNINLYCAAVGLSTVTRGTMDAVAIQALLGLNEHQEPLLNNPVGFPAK